MKFVSLFSGCGGMDRGLELAGHECILQAEIDMGAQQVLREHWPHVQLVPDVAAITSLPRETELLVAGFPCIDVSRAGLRKGLKGNATRLVSHVFRLLERSKQDHQLVPWVLLENVEALLDRAHGEEPLIDYVVTRIEELGYVTWAHRVINSAAFGVPNRRRRVFIVASLHGDARDVLLSQGMGYGVQEPGTCLGACQQLFGGACCYRCHEADVQSCSFAIDLGNARSAPVVDMVPTFTTCNERMCILMEDGRVGMLRTEDAERLQGLEPGWTEACYPVLQPGVGGHRSNQWTGRNNQEVEKRDPVRWSLIGNAVTVQVAEWIGQRLSEPYRYKYTVGASDHKLGPRQDPNYKQLMNNRCISCKLLHNEDYAEVTTVDAAAIQRHITAVEPAAQEEQTDNHNGQSAASSKAKMQGKQVTFEVASDLARKPSLAKTFSSGGIAAQTTISRAGTFMMLAHTTPKAMSFVRAALPCCYTLVQGFWRSSARDSWPRAAWYIRALGRYAADVSEAPVIQALEPLGEFLTTVGRFPGQDALHTYLQRLREHGFNVDVITKRLDAAGVALAAEVTIINRLEEHEDGRCIGEIVWVLHPSKNIWWPAELLDPFNMPQNRTLPEGSLSDLSLHDIQCWLPSQVRGIDSDEKARADTASVDRSATPAEGSAGPDSGGTQPATPQQQQQEQLAELRTTVESDSNTESNSAPVAITSCVDEAANGAALHMQHQHGMTGGAHDSMNPTGDAADDEAADLPADKGGAPSSQKHTDAHGQAAQDTADTCSRKVCAFFFADRGCRWVAATCSRPFVEHREELQVDGVQKLQRRRVGGVKLFRKAVQEAHQAYILQQGSDRAGYGRALSAHASSKAVAANLQAKCGLCENCKIMQSGVPRRCLFNRVAAAAASGHSGAQLAVRKEGALGARVSIWWPMDEAYYQGTITDFDPLRYRHSVSYDDGDVELVQLWAPQEVVRVLNRPADWPQQAQTVKEMLAQRRKETVQPEVGATREGDEAVADAVPIAMNEYEQLRESNIRRNKAMLQGLALVGDKQQDPPQQHQEPARHVVRAKRAITSKLEGIPNERASPLRKRASVAVLPPQKSVTRTLGHQGPSGSSVNVRTRAGSRLQGHDQADKGGGGNELDIHVKIDHQPHNKRLRSSRGTNKADELPGAWSSAEQQLGLPETPQAPAQSKALTSRKSHTPGGRTVVCSICQQVAGAVEGAWSAVPCTICGSQAGVHHACLTVGERRKAVKGRGDLMVYCISCS